jgi:3D (Asp-Asp-Asp) domain-containing protein
MSKNSTSKKAMAATLIVSSVLSSGCNHNNNTNKIANETVVKTSVVSQRESVNLDIHKDYRRSELNQQYIKNGKRMIVGATAYCNDPITYNGNPTIEGRTIAVDPNVIPYGTRVYIPKFNRVFIADDCGSAIKGNRIDIYMDDYDKCMDWGYRDIEIYILKD